jgi:hypothetical protein
MYDRLGSRPVTLGEMPLEYDMLGARLRAIGPAMIDYDHLGSRPRTLGSWALDYDMLGSRLRQVGPHEVTYKMLGSRVHTVGPMTLGYDRLGSRPKRVQVPGAMGALPPELLVALYFVLYEQRRKDETRRQNA